MFLAAAAAAAAAAVAAAADDDRKKNGRRRKRRRRRKRMTYRIWVSDNASIYWVTLGIVCIHDDPCQAAYCDNDEHARGIQ